MENWLEANPEGIIEDGKILIIGRQVTTNLGGYIDLLGVDKDGDLIVVELKRDRTPRDTLAQALEYSSFADRLDFQQLEEIFKKYLNDDSLDLAEYHTIYFGRDNNAAVAFNKDQRIVIVGQKITPEIRQTSAYLQSKGININCIKFTFFQTEDGKQLMSQEVVVGRESEKPTTVSSGSLPKVTKEEFLLSLDESGRLLFSKILEFAGRNSMPIHWGTEGFSLNVDLDGDHVSIVYCYPPDCIYKQTIYTDFFRSGGVFSKTDISEEVQNKIIKDTQNSDLFIPAGFEYKCIIDHNFSETEEKSLFSWIESVRNQIHSFGIKN